MGLRVWALGRVLGATGWALWIWSLFERCNPPIDCDIGIALDLGMAWALLAHGQRRGLRHQHWPSEVSRLMGDRGGGECRGRALWPCAVLLATGRGAWACARRHPSHKQRQSIGRGLQRCRLTRRGTVVTDGGSSPVSTASTRRRHSEHGGRETRAVTCAPVCAYAAWR